MLLTKFRFIWPSGFRGEDFFKSANQKQVLPVMAMFVNGSRQNVQSLERTFYRCFLPSFSSFGWGVSEEKIKMWKVNGWQTMDTERWQKLTLPLDDELMCQGLKLRKYFRGQMGPHQINFGSPHNLLGAHQARCRKPWDKWCKILHSGHFLAEKIGHSETII
jgi:hypothetical protein